MRVRPSLILPLAAVLALCIYRADVKLAEASAEPAGRRPPSRPRARLLRWCPRPLRPAGAARTS